MHLNLYISIYLGRNLHVLNVKIICNLFPLDHANGSLIIFYVSTTRKSIYIFTKSVKTLWWEKIVLWGFFIVKFTIQLFESKYQYRTLFFQMRSKTFPQNTFEIYLILHSIFMVWYCTFNSNGNLVNFKSNNFMLIETGQVTMEVFYNNSKRIKVSCLKNIITNISKKSQRWWWCMQNFFYNPPRFSKCLLQCYEAVYTKLYGCLHRVVRK